MYTCFFVHQCKVLQDIKVTYCCIVCDIIPQKKDTQKVYIMVGGDKLTYYVLVSTPTTDLTTAKLDLNSVLSTPDAKYLIVYVKNFYLKNPMNKG